MYKVANDLVLLFAVFADFSDLTITWLCARVFMRFCPCSDVACVHVDEWAAWLMDVTLPWTCHSNRAVSRNSRALRAGGERDSMMMMMMMRSLP